MSISFLEKASAAIRDVPDFPEPGIVFKDITPLLLRPDLLEGVIERMAEEFRDSNVEKILAIDSRGFILGAPVALRLGV
ncbi:MAG: adenine phosphoribosyltransferase, partial [Gemmatimonadetes bacterium]|nr:adenine phosphoribosyltransferase [Gemmatimonadota bacterium]